MKKRVQVLLLWLLLVFGGKCFGQITSCAFLMPDSVLCSPGLMTATANEVTNSAIVSRSWLLTTCAGATVYTTGNGLNATFSYPVTAPGCYCLQVVSVDQNGDTCVYQQCNITVTTNPVANTSVERTICYNVVTQLNENGGSNFEWSPPALFSNPNIGDPTIVLLTDTVATYAYINHFGCLNVDTMSLTIAHVTAQFNVPHTFCSGNSVCVTDMSTKLNDSIISYTYSFGDGHIVYGPDNCYIYPTAGNYNITLIDVDDFGCTDTITKPVLIFAKPEANFSISDTVICGNQQICLTDLTTGPAQITNWLWGYGDNSGTSQSTPPCHTYSSPYQHHYTISLFVTDQNNCSDSFALVETLNENPQANFTWVESCENAETPLTSTSVAMGGALTSCQWLLWVGATNPTIDNNCNTSFQLPAGTHNVQLVVTDVNGCTDTLVQPVKTDSLTTLSLTPADTTVCLGTSIEHSVNGVFNNVNWVNDVWLSSAHASVDTITPLGDVTYVVTVKDGACPAISDSFTVNVIQHVPIELSAVPGQILVGAKSNITSQIEGQIDSIAWNPDSTLSCRSCPNPIAAPYQTTTYTATIFYTQNGISCSNSAQVTVKVLNSCENGIIYVPNTFTPNGDGKNDVFMIRGLDASSINYFRVWDRWGKLAFEATGGVPNDPQFGWDGTDKQGKKLNPEVYVYTYEIQCVNGNIVAGNGSVTLVR